MSKFQGFSKATAKNKKSITVFVNTGASRTQHIKEVHVTLRTIDKEGENLYAYLSLSVEGTEKLIKDLTERLEWVKQDLYTCAKNSK